MSRDDRIEVRGPLQSCERGYRFEWTTMACHCGDRHTASGTLDAIALDLMASWPLMTEEIMDEGERALVESVSRCAGWSE